jgi:predicted lipoprotein with Yx(FWY)xxD motif
MNIKYLASAGLAIVIAAVAVAVFAIGRGNAKATQSQATASSAISIGSTSLGKTLVDAKGRTLYLFEGDRANISTLSSAGAAVWPRFVSSGPVKAGNGVQAALIGTTTSPTGVKQVTYQGHPLYYYVGDSSPGSTRGQGLNEFGALWYVLGPSGNAITSAPSTSAAAPAAPAPAGGYGY